MVLGGFSQGAVVGLTSVVGAMLVATVGPGEVLSASPSWGVFIDEHQMGSYGPRMFIPPFSDPVDPDVHPLIWREVNLIGSNMALRLEQIGHPLDGFGGAPELLGRSL